MNSQQGISIIQVPDAHIISNIIFSDQNLSSAIFFNNSNGYIRKNLLVGHAQGISLANSSPKCGENQILFNRVNGIYASTGSIPDLRLSIGVSITQGCPPYYYALSGCNEIFENGGFSQYPFVFGDDGSEIYIANSYILMDIGNNQIVDDREEIPPVYHTLLLMNGRLMQGQREIQARYNWWGTKELTPERFGDLSVIYEPIGADGCPVPIDPPCSLIVNGTDKAVVDTLYPLYEAEEFSQLDELFAEADAYYLAGDYDNAKMIYNDIVEEYPDSLQTFTAASKLFTIQKTQDTTYNNFTELQNFYDNYINNISDTLLMNMTENLKTLCYIGKEEYETAISRFEDIIIQNPGEEEAIYAEIDAITTAMLADSGSGNLGKYSGKYSSSTVEEYGNKISNLINKLGSSGKETANEMIVPVEYKLYQNYPNPFNPVTTIKYDIVKSQDVKVTVYDILGKEIVTLVNEQQQPGSYEVKFNAANLSSGIYFYQLKAGGFIDTKKMILIK